MTGRLAKLAFYTVFRLSFGNGEGHDIAESAISIRGLSHRYRGQEKPALDGVNLEVAEGEFVAVMGPSGAGKSTLCTALNGLSPYFFRGRMEGEVKVRGRSTRERKVGEFAREVGPVFQDFEAQLFSTNVALGVAFGPNIRGLEEAEAEERVSEALAAVGLEGYEKGTLVTHTMWVAAEYAHRAAVVRDNLTPPCRSCMRNYLR